MDSSEHNGFAEFIERISQVASLSSIDPYLVPCPIPCPSQTPPAQPEATTHSYDPLYATSTTLDASSHQRRTIVDDEASARADADPFDGGRYSREPDPLHLKSFTEEVKNPDRALDGIPSPRESNSIQAQAQGGGVETARPSSHAVSGGSYVPSIKTVDDGHNNGPGMEEITRIMGNPIQCAERLGLPQGWECKTNPSGRQYWVTPRKQHGQSERKRLYSRTGVLKFLQDNDLPVPRYFRSETPRHYTLEQAMKDGPSLPQAHIEQFSTLTSRRPEDSAENMTSTINPREPGTLFDEAKTMRRDGFTLKNTSGDDMRMPMEMGHMGSESRSQKSLAGGPESENALQESAPKVRRRCVRKAKTFSGLYPPSGPEESLEGCSMGASMDEGARQCHGSAAADARQTTGHAAEQAKIAENIPETKPKRGRPPKSANTDHPSTAPEETTMNKRRWKGAHKAIAEGRGSGLAMLSAGELEMKGENPDLITQGAPRQQKRRLSMIMPHAEQHLTTAIFSPQDSTIIARVREGDETYVYGLHKRVEEDEDAPQRTALPADPRVMTYVLKNFTPMEGAFGAAKNHMAQAEDTMKSEESDGEALHPDFQSDLGSVNQLGEASTWSTINDMSSSETIASSGRPGDNAVGAPTGVLVEQNGQAGMERNTVRKRGRRSRDHSPGLRDSMRNPPVARHRAIRGELKVPTRGTSPRMSKRTCKDSPPSVRVRKDATVLTLEGPHLATHDGSGEANKDEEEEEEVDRRRRRSVLSREKEGRVSLGGRHNVRETQEEEMMTTKKKPQHKMGGHIKGRRELKHTLRRGPVVKKQSVTTRVSGLRHSLERRGQKKWARVLRLFTASDLFLFGCNIKKKHGKQQHGGHAKNQEEKMPDAHAGRDTIRARGKKSYRRLQRKNSGAPAAAAEGNHDVTGKGIRCTTDARATPFMEGEEKWWNDFLAHVPLLDLLDEKEFKEIQNKLAPETASMTMKYLRCLNDFCRHLLQGRAFDDAMDRAVIRKNVPRREWTEFVMHHTVMEWQDSESVVSDEVSEPDSPKPEHTTAIQQKLPPLLCSQRTSREVETKSVHTHRYPDRRNKENAKRGSSSSIPPPSTSTSTSTSRRSLPHHQSHRLRGQEATSTSSTRWVSRSPEKEPLNGRRSSLGGRGLSLCGKNTTATATAVNALSCSFHPEGERSVNGVRSPTTAHSRERTPRMGRTERERTPMSDVDVDVVPKEAIQGRRSLRSSREERGGEKKWTQPHAHGAHDSHEEHTPMSRSGTRIRGEDRMEEESSRASDEYPSRNGKKGRPHVVRGSRSTRVRTPTQQGAMRTERHGEGPRRVVCPPPIREEARGKRSARLQNMGEEHYRRVEEEGSAFGKG